MSHGQAIAKNAAWLLAAQTVQKLIAFVTFSLIAKWVGAEVTGHFFYAVSVTSVFVILADLGMTPVVIREMAGDEEHGRGALATALKLKAIFIPIAILASLAYAISVRADASTLTAIAIACFVMSADAVSLLWYGAIRGRRKLQYEALGMLVGQLGTAAVSLLAIIVFHWGVYGLIFALSVGSAWNVIWSVTQARRLRLSPLWKLSWRWQRLMRAAVPFALAGIFVKVYSYADTLMLKEFYSARDVGWYAVAYKVTYAFQFLPLAFVAALYPGMSAAYASKEKETLQKLIGGSLRLMTIVAVPLSAALSAFAPRLIPLAYGTAYDGTILPLMILAWVLIPIFWDFPTGSLLNATHRAEQKTASMGIAMVVNVFANALLVPPLGPTGAAISGLISFWLLFFVGLYFIRRDLPSFDWAISLFGRGLIVAAAIWFAIRFVTPAMPLVAALAFGVMASLALLFLSRLLLVEDVRMMLRVFKRTPRAPDSVDESGHDGK